MCTYNPPITPKTLRLKPPNPYGQIIIVNKIYYSYLHVKSGAVCPQIIAACEQSPMRKTFRLKIFLNQSIYKNISTLFASHSTLWHKVLETISTASNFRPHFTVTMEVKKYNEGNIISGILYCTVVSDHIQQVWKICDNFCLFCNTYRISHVTLFTCWNTSRKYQLTLCSATWHDITSIT